MMNPFDEEKTTEESEIHHVKSKTERKREMVELQDLGKKLINFTEKQLQILDLPLNLLEALAQARKLKRGEALRRQTQYIGVLMRSVDPEPIKLLVENIDQIRKKEVNEFHQLEIYRDLLLGGDSNVFGELISKFPHLDRQHLKQLVRNTIKEKKKNKPPKNFRLIFDYLKEISELNNH